MKAILVHHPGGPEELNYADIDIPKPAPGQALVKIAAIGVNFIDVYHRTGFYKLPLPFTPGQEAAGVIESLGEGVTEFAPGDRVAYTSVPGAYAEYATVPAKMLVKVPDGVDLTLAAASMLQGMTAHYLTHSTFPLKEGHTALVHAAAGGAGLMLVQMAKALGAKVIGTMSTEAKAEMARKAGADETILYSTQDFEVEVKRITDGKGVDVVYDSVGATTFHKSLNCIRPRGMMVTFGQSSGPVGQIDPLVLSQRGSLFLTRPMLAFHIATREELAWRAGDVLGDIASGKLHIHIDKTYKLSEVAQAHRDLESRKTTGKLVLLPR
jgi:NADPH2:quinone reductase